MPKQMFIDFWSETINASHSKYVFSDRVPNGHVLCVSNCYASAPDATVNDMVWIGVRNGGKDCLIRKRKVRTENIGLSALNAFLAGEGDQVFAYFPDASNTHKVELHVNGILLPIKEWREQSK